MGIEEALEVFPKAGGNLLQNINLGLALTGQVFGDRALVDTGPFGYFARTLPAFRDQAAEIIDGMFHIDG